MAGRTKWVNAFHGTAGSVRSELIPHGGFVWATLSPEHASSYAMSDRAYWKSGNNQPIVRLLQVNIAGFLIIDGGGEEIREVDGEMWRTGWTPYDVVRQLKLPGILFRQVRDTVDEDRFRRAVNLVAVAGGSALAAPLHRSGLKHAQAIETSALPADRQKLAVVARATMRHL